MAKKFNGHVIPVYGPKESKDGREVHYGSIGNNMVEIIARKETGGSKPTFRLDIQDGNGNLMPVTGLWPKKNSKGVDVLKGKPKGKKLWYTFSPCRPGKKLSESQSGWLSWHSPTPEPITKRKTDTQHAA